MRIKLFIFTLCTLQPLLQAENVLQEACGDEAVSSENIQALYSWGKRIEAGIGTDYQPTHLALHASGLIINEMEEFQTHYLNAISFDDHESPAPSKELIAREYRSLNEIPSRKASMTAMGAPRKK